ncbi:MAG TPA: calcium/proton exchanger [Acidisphaera sp.]|nr:calcium/proton exchanger [Acidisphaera sp.]
MELGPSIRRTAPLLAVPVSLVLHYTDAAPPLWVFFTGLIAIAVLADWVRRGTEQVAEIAGGTIGSLLNVSFGNAAELVLALFVLSAAQPQIVQAQITGSIIGTTLLFLGISALAGGLRHPRQTFGAAQAGLLTTMLLLVAVAILLPAAFDMAERVLEPNVDRAQHNERFSLGVSVVLLLLYGAHLIYILVTHRNLFRSDGEGGRAEWSLPQALGVMIGGTVVIAVEAELVTARLAEASAQLGFSPVFMGVVVLALVGTIADLFASVAFARADRMDIAFGMCVGSALQIALVIAPVLVLVSYAIGHPMTLVFSSPLDLFAIASAAFIVRAIAADGETNWYEGFLLVGVYVLFALGYFFEA